MQADKQDVGKMKEDMETKEAIKEAERKRREKLDDQKARAAIKAQIEVCPLQIRSRHVQPADTAGGQEGKSREGS
jgi:hypothetical protein